MSHFTKNVVFGTGLILILLYSTSGLLFAQGVSSDLKTDQAETEVGRTIAVSLLVDSENSAQIFTVSASLVYDSSMLDFKSAIMEDTWVNLAQKETYITDTVNGLVMRTGGYPGGFSSSTKFVTYMFEAKKAGDTKIFINTGKAYNENNLDVGIKKSEIVLQINEEKSEGANQEEVTSVNVIAKIESDNAFYKQDDYPFSIYHKKESKHQQAITKIWLFDERGGVIYQDERLWRTDRDTVLDFIIPSYTVENEGNYKIIAKVRYEDDVEFEVLQKEIGVLSNGQTWFTKNSHIFMPVFFMFAFVSIIHHYFMEREIYFKFRQILRSKRRKTGKSRSS